MYLNHWGMKRRPFDNSHNQNLFVPVESTMLALTRMRYAVAMGLGVACLSGDAGTGKTELAKVCMHDFENSGWATIYISNPSGSRDSVFLNILHKLEGEIIEEHTVFESLENRIEFIGKNGGKILLVLDDAHAISDISLLNDIRMLYNIEIKGTPVLSMIIVGQEGIYGKLSEASSFNTKVGMKVKLVPLNEDETATYILARIKASRCNRGVFTKKAAEMVYEASGGNPGNINRICELALITAFTEGHSKIKPDIIIAVARELGLRNDLGTQRMLDEVWAEDLVPVDEYAEAEEDILASLEMI